jgi:hypothetical protein
VAKAEFAVYVFTVILRCDHEGQLIKVEFWIFL